MKATTNKFIDKVTGTAAANLAARAQSERAVLLVLGLLVLVFGVYIAVIEPSRQRISASEAELARAESQQSALRASMDEMSALLEQDPNEVSRARLQALVREQERLNAEIASLAGDLTTPEAMTDLLISMLERQEGLSLISFSNVPAVPVVIDLVDSAATTDRSQVGGSAGPVADVLYEHGLTLRFGGDFHSTLQYLKFLESISASFFWDSLTLTQEQWPNAQVELQIHTLSTEGGFIGV